MRDERAYLLLCSMRGCSDGDTLFGIYTEKEALHAGVARLREWVELGYTETKLIVVYAFKKDTFSGKLLDGDCAMGEYEVYVLDEQAKGREKRISELWEDVE